MAQELIANKTNRLDWIDSIKGLFILLVVFGHVTSGSDTMTEGIQVSRYLIYSFHMPMFILITGLFSKKKQDVKRIVSGYVVPYIIFDFIYVLWCMVTGKEFDFLILIPTFVYWYILCIAIQKMMLRYIKSIPILLIIAFAIQIGTLFVSEDVWRVLSLGRVGLLFPVFYLGYLIPMDKLREMRRKKLISALIGIASVSINFLLYYIRLVPISATHNYYSSLPALGVKYIYMLTTVGLFIALNAFLPENKVLCRWGKNSLIIYLLHPYFTDVIGHFVRHSVKSDMTAALICVLSAICITEFLSIDLFKKIYDRFLNKINKTLGLVR